MDANQQFARWQSASITRKDIASSLPLHGGLNDLYFRQEDRLNAAAASVGGSFNLQLGFVSSEGVQDEAAQMSEAIATNTFFDAFLEERVIPWIEEGTDLLAISIVERNQLLPALRLVRLLRGRGYDRQVVLGGNLITRLKDDLLKSWLFDLVDYLVVFQGETPLVRLCEALRKERPIESVPSLIWRGPSGAIVQNKLMERDEQVCDTLPAPSFDGLNLDQYWGTHYLPLVHFRGCFFGRCPFCPIPYAWGYGGFAGASSVEKVLADMVALQTKYGMHRFQFVDEAFPSHSALELADLISSRGAPFEWMIFARFDKRWGDAASMRRMAKGGLKKIHLGLEIIEGPNRNALGKKDQAKSIDAILKAGADSGIKVHLFCLFGYPRTDIADAERTVDFILKNRSLIDSVDINPYLHYRHTSADGIEVLKDPKKDWALTYDYVRKEDRMTSQDIVAMSEALEGVIWKEAPLLLHPLYRIHSPWN